MREGSGLNGGDTEIEYSALLNAYHNLKIAEECFRHLLNIMGEGTRRRNFPEYEIKEDRIDFECLLKLSTTNIELARSINERLLEKSRNGTRAGRACGGHSGMPVRVNGRRREPAPSGEAEELNRRFRESIVDLMVLSVQCWEQCTRKSRIDLAEESRIWCVNVDGGRLRVRSMDRYLGVNKLPKVPRWRDVIRTAYFVLDRVEGESSIRDRLENSLDRTLAIMRKQAL